MSSIELSLPGSGPTTNSDVPDAKPTAEDALGLIEDHIQPRLDPVVVRYLVDVVSKQTPSHLISLDDVRAHPERYRSPIAIDTSKHERVSDHVVSSQDGVSFTVRVYHPDPAKFGPGPYPVHMNHHGTRPSDCQPHSGW
jgi:hypothetical protein